MLGRNNTKLSSVFNKCVGNVRSHRVTRTAFAPDLHFSSNSSSSSVLIPRQQSSTPTSFPPLVWFLLLDSTTGQPYKGTSAEAVALPPGAVVAQFRKVAQLEHSNKLSSFDAADLLVYKNKAAFSKRYSNAVDDGHTEWQPLDPTLTLHGLGSKEDMLVVVVPPSSRNASSSSGTGQSTTQSCSGKEPDHQRIQRWDELNQILDGNLKKSKINDSTSYSSITWKQVESIFNPTRYVQPQRAVDDTQIDFLAQYLSYTTQCFGPITTGKEAKRLHFIAPVLVCVCFLLEGDVEIVAEEDLVGEYVKAHGHFEFMLRRGNKVICIVEAKKDDIEQGMAQDLVGCEVAAEVGGLDVVYGIVTNYVQWNFIRSSNNKVEMEECSLSLESEGPEKQSLKRIIEKIYSMLSD